MECRGGHTYGLTDRVTNYCKYMSCSMQLKIFIIYKEIFNSLITQFDLKQEAGGMLLLLKFHFSNLVLDYWSQYSLSEVISGWLADRTSFLLLVTTCVLHGPLHSTPLHSS